MVCIVSLHNMRPRPLEPSLFPHTMLGIARTIYLYIALVSMSRTPS